MSEADGSESLYVGLVKSQLLDESVNSERNVIEWSSPGLFSYPSEKEVLGEVEELCSEFLKSDF